MTVPVTAATGSGWRRAAAAADTPRRTASGSGSVALSLLVTTATGSGTLAQWHCQAATAAASEDWQRLPLLAVPLSHWHCDWQSQWQTRARRIIMATWRFHYIGKAAALR